MEGFRRARDGRGIEQAEPVIGASSGSRVHAPLSPIPRRQRIRLAHFERSQLPHVAEVDGSTRPVHPSSPEVDSVPGRIRGRDPMAGGEDDARGGLLEPVRSPRDWNEGRGRADARYDVRRQRRLGVQRGRFGRRLLPLGGQAAGRNPASGRAAHPVPQGGPHIQGQRHRDISETNSVVLQHGHRRCGSRDRRVREARTGGV